MATSDRSLPGQSGRQSDARARPSRYDLVLALIPVVLVASLVVSHVFPVPTEASLAAASLVGSVAMVDAMFLNPPESGA